MTPRVGQIRFQRQRSIIALERFLVSLLLEQRVSAKGPAHGQIRPRGHDVFIREQCFGVPAELRKGSPARADDLDQTWPHSERSVVARQGVHMPIQVLQRHAAMVQRIE